MSLGDFPLGRAVTLYIDDFPNGFDLLAYRVCADLRIIIGGRYRKYNIIIGRHQQVKILTTGTFGRRPAIPRISVSGTFIKHLTSDVELDLKIPVLHYKGPFCSGDLSRARTLEFTGGDRFLVFSLHEVQKIRFHGHYNCPNIRWLREIRNIDVVVNEKFLIEQNPDLHYCWPNCCISSSNTAQLKSSIPPGF